MNESLKTLPSVGLVYDWIQDLGGGERVLHDLIRTFPNSELFVPFFKENAENRKLLNGIPLHTSGLNKLPSVDRYYRNLVLLAARAIERFDVSKFDVVVSASSAIAKGVITSPHQPHIGYVFSPPRYAWDLSHEYRRIHNIDGGIKGIIAHEMMHRFRLWDARTIRGVDVFITISDFVRRRAWKVYRRDSLVLYPPVDTSKFRVERKTPRHFVTASRLVGYKRVDILVKAFAARPDLKLVVIGEGPEMESLKSVATSNVEFLGRATTEQMLDAYSEARAFLYGALEDFGISPLEAQAAGIPVIAYGQGGSLETIIGTGENKARTGVFFDRQDTQSVLDAITAFEALESQFQEDAIRANSRRFSQELFKSRFEWVVENAFELARVPEFGPTKIWEDAKAVLAEG